MSNKQRAIDLLTRAVFHLRVRGPLNPNMHEYEHEYEELYTAIQILNALKELVYYVG